MAVLVGDEVDRQTQVPKTSGAPDPVEVGLSVLGEVEIDYYVHRLDVNTTGEQICEQKGRRQPRDMRIRAPQ